MEEQQALLRYVRRVSTNVESKSDQQQTQDPYALAHKLINWSSKSSAIVYSRYLRSSTIYDSCVREQALGYMHSERFHYKHVPVSMSATFEIGNAVHFWLQNQPKFFGDRLIGIWTCLACGSSRFGRRPKTKCLKCGASPSSSVYTELTLKVGPPLYGQGHVDLLLEVDPGRIYICDIKTIAGDSFKALDEPLIQNVYQVVDYMLLMLNGGAKDIPVSVQTDKALVLYVPKAHQSTAFPGKAFWVQRDGFIEEAILSKRRQFAKAVETGKLPEPLTECKASKFAAYRSRQCALMELCKKTYEES